MTEIKFGDIFLAELTGDGHEQRGRRACIITQNDVGNLHSPTVEIIPLSANVHKARHLPCHVLVQAVEVAGLRLDSLALAEQPKTIDKRTLLYRIGGAAGAPWWSCGGHGGYSAPSLWSRTETSR